MLLMTWLGAAAGKKPLINRMKILILSDDFPPANLGGAGSVAASVAGEFKRRGNEVAVISTSRHRSPSGQRTVQSTYQGMTVHSVFSKYNPFFQAYVSLWNPPVVREVERIISEYKPDVVHAHNVHGHLSYRSLVVAKRSGAKVILTCHDVLSFHFGKYTEFINRADVSVPLVFNYKISPFRQARAYRFRYNPFRNMTIRRILSRSVDHVVAVSYALRQAMNQNGIRRVDVVHNGIDPHEWRVSDAAVSAFKTKFELDGRQVILFEGRLGGAKGGAEIMQALPLIKKSISDVTLLVVGTKEKYGEHMELSAKKQNIDIRFTGWLEGDNLHCAHAAADVVIFPSVCFDTFGMVNIEGMVMKKPVVATCFGGAPEIVQDGRTGFIVNPYNIQDMAEKITLLLRDAHKRAEFGSAGYRRVLESFTLAQQADAYDLLYR
jgi:glycosyltransferase involved in cell wall biosynthesis